MIWSIVARDSATGAFGTAVATRFFAVGALCPHGDGGNCRCRTAKAASPS